MAMAVNFALYPPNFNEVGAAFAKNYYETLQVSKEKTAMFYHDQALMTYEGQQFSGREGILQKFQSLAWQKIAIAITNTDSHPTENGVLVYVTGQLKTDEDPAIGFSEAFLLRNVNGSYAIVNHIFRLSIHHFA